MLKCIQNEADVALGIGSPAIQAPKLRHNL